MSERAQVFASEAGDTLVGLVRRVYEVHEHERVCQVAAIVAAMTARNVKVIKQRLHEPLQAGLEIDFPAWSQVAAKLRVLEQNREQALAHARKPVAKMSALAAPQMVRKTSGTTEALVAAAGERAEVLAQALTVLSPEASQPMRTQSPAAASVQRIGEAIGARLPLETLAAIAGEKRAPALLRFVMTVAPKTFVSEQAAAATVQVLAAGVHLGQLRRLETACREEYTRRQRQLHAALEHELAPTTEVVASKAIAGTAAEVLAVLRAHTDDAPAVTPKIRTGLATAWGQPDLGGGPEVAGFLRFIDTFDDAHEDGALQAQLLAFSAGGDAQLQAVTRAEAQLKLVAVKEDAMPSADFATALPELLRVMRTRRASLGPAEQQREVAEERRMLAGRNYTSFRKDINAAIDTRLTLATSLAAPKKRAVYLALLTTVGHRLSGMDKAQIEAALDKLISATGGME